MKNITLAHKLRYQFDNTMAKGSVALIGWLFIASAAMIIMISLFVFLLGLVPTTDDGSSLSFAQVVWMSLMRTMDAGNMADDAGSWLFMFSMLAVTMGGIFVVSILIGVLTSGIEGKLEELRKGRSLVVEEGHTVILGWSEQIFSIISELVIANANRPRACIAILAEKDKVEMEDELRARVGATGKTRIVCRTGNPIDLTDLSIANPHYARSIIVLAPVDGDTDSQVIKTVLALTNHPNRRSAPYHIVAELRHPRNMEVARMVGKDELQPVLANDLIARIMAQACRQSGLSVVYTELLDFDGDEIYFHQEPALVGKTFGEALLAYEDSTLIGLQFGDGRVQLCPPPDTVIQANAQVIVISEDDDTVRLSGLSDYQINQQAIQLAHRQAASPEQTLVLGWNQRGAAIITELDHYVAPGSGITVVADVPEIETEVAAHLAHLVNHNVTCRVGDTTDSTVLKTLNLTQYRHVIVLSYSDTLDPQAADSRTLVTLLHLRHIAETMARPFSIVSEMLDIRNRNLAAVTRADDFIVSDKLVSLMLAQISENKQLAAVFQDLFDAEGVELYLKAASDFVQPGQPVNFYTVVEAARRYGEVAIGYRLAAQADEAERGYGVYLNPPKSNLVTFSADDRVVVLADS